MFAVRDTPITFSSTDLLQNVCNIYLRDAVLDLSAPRSGDGMPPPLQHLPCRAGHDVRDCVPDISSFPLPLDATHALPDLICYSSTREGRGRGGVGDRAARMVNLQCFDSSHTLLH